MALASKVNAFLEEAKVGKKRAAPAPIKQEGAPQPPGQQLFLPVSLQLEHGNKEAREQLLWQMGETKLAPAMAARAFASAFLNQPQQLERETARLQRELDLVLGQHKDLVAAPAAPALVQLEVRVRLPHLGAVFLDEPIWDCSAPRAACESYVAQVCNEMGLDWHAHTLILRCMKDVIDVAREGLASGKVQPLPYPTGAALVRDAPSNMPQVVRMTEQQLAAVREALNRQREAAGLAAGEQQAASPSLTLTPTEVAAAAAVDVSLAVKQEDGAAAAEAEAAAGAAAAAAAREDAVMAAAEGNKDEGAAAEEAAGPSSADTEEEEEEDEDEEEGGGGSGSEEEEEEEDEEEEHEGDEEDEEDGEEEHEEEESDDEDMPDFD